MKSLVLGIAVAMGLSFTVVEADAGNRGYRGEGAHKSSSYYRKGTRVKGYTKRRGGYSYKYEDSINTYGNSRSNYGGVNAWRDYNADRQTNAGPFDHGFFFDSGIAPHGGSSPYMH
ncbi:MAG: hypothetical protein RIC14_11700 [Filomicrobium sp.]